MKQRTRNGEPLKENATLKDQYLKLHEDHNATRTEEANTTWRERTPSITQPTPRATNAKNRLYPFIDGIMEAQLPPEWKTLTIDLYDGLLDPDEHVEAFVTQMNLFKNDDIIMC